jgi:hypothetical protein
MIQLLVPHMVHALLQIHANVKTIGWDLTVTLQVALEWQAIQVTFVLLMANV